jgi:putative ABC transport system substrate-binding protein
MRRSIGTARRQHRVSASWSLRRRDFILLLGAAAVWSLPVTAEQPTNLARIGFLGLAPASASASRVEALRAGLRDLGWVEGKNILIEFRWAQGVEQLPDLAAELVQMNVDIIFAPSSTFVEGARKATQTIPIVFALNADPVGLGHVASLARPGGNITGLTMQSTELNTKQLQILKETVPQSTRFGVLWNPSTPSHKLGLPATEAAGETLGISLIAVPVRTAEDFDQALATMAQEHVGGFLDLASPLTYSERTRLAEAALKNRLPGMFGIKANAEAGGLMSYAADINDLHRRAAAYIDKILKGAKPADLPVEQASKFEFVINLKTAKALGLEFPPMVLARANEVIE